MIPKKYLRNKFSIMWKRMTESLHAFCRTHDLEELHRMRVEIKKITALASLLQYASGKTGYMDSIAPAKEISSKAGDIRNLQLTLGLLEEYTGKNSKDFKDFSRKLEHEITGFCTSCDSFSEALSGIRKKFSGSIQDMRKGQVISFFTDGLNQIKQLSREKVNPGSLHECRKAIKKLVYAYAVAGKPVQNKIDFDKARFRKIEKKIGEWHDIEITLGILKQAGFSDEVVIGELSARCNKLIKSCCRY